MTFLVPVKPLHYPLLCSVKKKRYKMKHLERVVRNCIEYAEQNDLGMFIFNNQKGSGSSITLSTRFK